MATRHQVRLAVVSLLYAQDLNESDFCDEFFEENKIRNKQLEFALYLLNGVRENLAKIDDDLNALLNEYKLNEIGAVEKAILRLGAYEIEFTQTQKAVIINEAIELAKELCGETSPKFINGVLDKIKAN